MRDILIAHYLGISPALDAFFVAFKFPNLIRRLYAEGIFSQALIPLLKEHSHNKKQFSELAGKVLGTLGAAALLFILLLAMFSHEWMLLLAPGYWHKPALLLLSSHLLTALCPYLLCVLLTAIIIAILNVQERFALGAGIPILLNIIIILGLLFFTVYFQQSIWMLVLAVLLAGSVQLLLAYLGLHRIGLGIKLKFNLSHPLIRQLAYGILPAIIGVSFFYLGCFVDMMFATTLSVGNVSWLYFAERLIVFPVSIIGTALALVNLPTLSALESSHKAFAGSLQTTLQHSILLAIPASLGLGMLATPLVLTLFLGGKFTWVDVLATSQTLKAFALGLPAFILIKILANGFYAQKKFKLPFICSLLAIFVNIVANFQVLHLDKLANFAYSTALAGWVNVILLTIFLWKEKVAISLDKAWCGKIVLASGALYLFIGWIQSDYQQWLNWPSLSRWLHLVSIIVASIILYTAIFYMVSYLMKVGCYLKIIFSHNEKNS